MALSIFTTVFIAWNIFSLQCEARAPKKLLSAVEATAGEFPWMVSLQRNDEHICGGVLISPIHVLSAAHCFIPHVEYPWTEGLILLTGSVKVNDGEIHFAEKVSIPDEFTPGVGSRWAHDVAVIKLTERITESPLQRPIALPSRVTPGNVVGQLCGFGRVSKYGPLSNVLLKANINIINNTKCNEEGARVLDVHLCGLNGEGTGFCDGDSGSPLVWNDQVVGIVSFSMSCGMNHPNAYVRVDRYVDFIMDSMIETSLDNYI